MEEAGGQLGDFPYRALFNTVLKLHVMGVCNVPAGLFDFPTWLHSISSVTVYSSRCSKLERTPPLKEGYLIAIWNRELVLCALREQATSSSGVNDACIVSRLIHTTP